RLVARAREASISLLQRHLRVGYNRAARMIERMEREGLVGPSDGIRRREVYVREPPGE
ncbi:MAG: DNA translocase FtsK, partial [Nitrospinota bacterium]